MTRLETTQETTAAALDRFRYGWRYVRHEHPVNGYIYEQIPLTLEDVLYPEVGDFIVHSKAHEDICNYLLNVFTERVHGDASAVVLHDVRVAWDVEGLRPNGPDITLLFGVQQVQNWSTFDCGEEGVRPALVVEVTSPDTRHQDFDTKVSIYEEAGVGQYLIIDTIPTKRQNLLGLYGYRQGVHGFELCQPNEHGWLWLDTLELWLGVDRQRIVCYTPDGQEVHSYTEVRAQARQAEAQARWAEAQARQAEAQAREEAVARAVAEARIRELEAELARLRGDAGTSA